MVIVQHCTVSAELNSRVLAGLIYISVTSGFFQRNLVTVKEKSSIIFLKTKNRN